MSHALAKLRERLAAIEQPNITRDVQPFGVMQLDGRLANQGLRVDALHEFAAPRPGWADDAPAILFMAGIAARSSGPVLWIVRRRDLYAPGLYQSGLAPERLIHAEARDDAELLAMMEDALRHRGLGAVIGEVKRAGLAATRRLQLAAEGGATLALLLRRHAKLADDPLAAPNSQTGNALSNGRANESKRHSKTNSIKKHKTAQEVQAVSSPRGAKKAVSYSSSHGPATR